MKQRVLFTALLLALNVNITSVAQGTGSSSNPLDSLLGTIRLIGQQLSTVGMDAQKANGQQPASGAPKENESKNNEPLSKPKYEEIELARLSETKLKGLFNDHPIDGSKPPPRFNGELWFPRVALIPLTVPTGHVARMHWGEERKIIQHPNQSESTYVVPPPERFCWVYSAKIWYSKEKHEDVRPFIYCMSDAMPYVLIGGARPSSFLSFTLISEDSSGALNTTGPRQPKNPVPQSFLDPTEHYVSSYRSLALMGIIHDMGIDPFYPEEGNRVWVATNRIVVKDW